MRDFKYIINYITNKILKEDNIAKSIQYAEILGDLLRTNNAPCYSLNIIEENLIKRFLSLCDIQKLDEKRSAGDIGFIISEAFERGGHTRLMEKLATYLDNKPVLFMTRQSKPSVILRLTSYFSAIKTFEGVSATDYEQRIIKQAAVYSQYDKLVLNIHPDDIQAVIAVGIAKHINTRLKVYFVNHADHCFTYGTFISDVWFEISSLGKIIDQKRDLPSTKSFLGIPIAYDVICENNHPIVDGDLFITAGTAIKFKPKKGYSLLGLIEEILIKFPDSLVYVVGCRPFIDYWWWPLKLRYYKRLILKKSLPYDRYVSLTSKAKVYIDSHPYPGGTAFAEQFIAGKKCIGLKSPLQGYSPVELVKHNTVDAVINDLPNYSNTNLNMLIDQVHSSSYVKKRFCDAIYNSIYHDNLCDKIIPWDGDASFLENDEIVRIPRSCNIISSTTLFLIVHSSPMVTILFFAEKMYFTIKNLLGKR